MKFILIFFVGISNAKASFFLKGGFGEKFDSRYESSMERSLSKNYYSIQQKMLSGGIQSDNRLIFVSLGMILLEGKTKNNNEHPDYTHQSLYVVSSGVNFLRTSFLDSYILVGATSATVTLKNKSLGGSGFQAGFGVDIFLHRRVFIFLEYNHLNVLVGEPKHRTDIAFSGLKFNF